MKKSSLQILAAARTLAVAFLIPFSAVAQQQDTPKTTGDDKPAPGSTSDAWKQALPQTETTGQAQGINTGGSQETAEQVERTLSTLEQKWMEAVKLQDDATLKRLLSEDFTLAGGAGDGASIDRTSYLDGIAKDWKLSSYTIDSLTVRLYGETALVTAVYRQQALVSGKDSSGEFLTTDIWVKTGKRWRAV